MIDARAFAEFERVILNDPGGRGVASFARPGEFESACRALATARRVGIVTGFYIPTADACETDGPLGACHLAKAIQRFARAAVCTDQWCLPVVQSLIPQATDDPSILEDCDALVAIERLGRAADGRYYSMRGADLTEWTEPLDEIFLRRRSGVATVGVGDGGNEIGMGSVLDRVKDVVTFGESIGSVVSTDHLVAAGVSNWGAWGLIAGLSLFHPQIELPTPDAAFTDLITLVAAGAVDGVTGHPNLTVDGLDWSHHSEILEWLTALSP